MQPAVSSKPGRDIADEAKRGKKRVPDVVVLTESDREEQRGKDNRDSAVVDRSSSGMPSRRRGSEAQVRRRRRRQREADLQRRYREQRSLAQLQQLMTPSSRIESEQKANDEEDEDGKLRTRADLLEESVQQIAQLQLLVIQLTSTCNELQQRSSGCAFPAERSLPALATPSTSLLRHLPPSASAFLANHVRRLSLHSSMFVHSPVAVTLLHVPSGLIADASESQLEHTGWERAHLIGRRMFPPLHVMLSDPMLMINPHAEIMRDNRTLVAGEGGRVVSSKQEPQYESSLRLAHQLVTGAKDIIVAVWRGQFADGKVQHTLHHEA